MQNKVLAVLFILGLGALAFCMIYLMEEYETTEWTDQSAEAKRNPFLAAEQFLTKRGVDVVKTTDILDFDNIPTDQTVLLTKVDSMLVSPRQVDSALRWIERGGYMIVGVENEIQGQTSLLNHFDIEPSVVEFEFEGVFGDDTDKSVSEQLRELNREIDRQEQNEDSKQEGQPPTGGDEPEQDELTQRLLRIYGADHDQEYFTLTINEADKIHLAVLDDLILGHWMVDEDDESNKGENGYTLNAWASDEEGQRLLQFYYGEGSFVALSSSKLWTNNHIQLGDHAYLLSYLVPDGSTLQLFYNINSPSFRAIVYRYFTELIWSSLAFLALWLWYRGARTQRVRSQTDSGRRSFAEHLRASAQYLTRQGSYTELIDAIKHDIEQQMRRQYPNFSQLNEATQVSILSEKTQISKTAITRWLDYCKQIEDREGFLAALQLGNAIRKQI